MSYPTEKSPEALAALNGTTTTMDHNPPPYDATHSPPPTILTNDEKAPAYSTTHPPPIDRSMSPNSLTSPSTTSLTSIDEASRPKTTTTTKFFISQQGNTLKPWPWSNSSELVTPIYDSTRTIPLFTSTRFKKCSGTCVFTPVYNAEQPQPVDPKDRFEVMTTYRFGPGNDPEISFETAAGGEANKVVIPVKSKGKLSRSRWFEWNGEKYEWRYLGNRHAEGMILQRVISSAELYQQNGATTPLQEKDLIITDEKRSRPVTPTSPRGCSKGKGVARKSDPHYVTVAEFMRDEEENKTCMGFSPAGQGGWITVYGKEGEALPAWLLLTSCLVMLKRERDRRAFQVAAMIGGGASGGP